MIRVALQNPDVIEAQIKRRMPTRDSFRCVGLEVRVLTDDHYKRIKDDKPVFSNEELGYFFPDTPQREAVRSLMQIIDSINLDVSSNGREYKVSAKVKTNPVYTSMDVEDLEQRLCFQDKKQGRYFLTGRFTKETEYDSGKKRVKEGWRAYEAEISLDPKPKEEKKSWNPFSRKKAETQKPNYMNIKGKEWKETWRVLAEFAKVLEDVIHNIYDSLRDCDVRVEEPELDLQIVPRYGDDYRQIVDYPTFSILNTEGTPTYFFFSDDKGNHKAGELSSLKRKKLRETKQYQTAEESAPDINEMTNRLFTYISMAKRYAKEGDVERTMKSLPSIEQQSAQMKGTYQTKAEVKKLDAYVTQQKAEILGILREVGK